MFRPVIIIPCYNHVNAFAQFAIKISQVGFPVIVVDDGGAPSQSRKLKKICAAHGFRYVHNSKNGGKGRAMKIGFNVARDMGFTHGLQIDADGQHNAADIVRFFALAEKNPNALIVGNPVYDDSAPRARRIGRKVTDFWVAVETLNRHMPDAMCGMRIYPLEDTCAEMEHLRFYRMGFDIEIMVPCDLERHIAHLQSGLLAGHNWHGARPSMLHLSIQDRVRECCSGNISLEEYMAIGTDIIRHEYFMVASHDICETSIIQSFPSVIPPIGSKSLSDFVFDGIPYDLKLTTHPDSWKPFAGNMSLEQKKQLAFELYEGADSERMRADAEKCRHNWGLNRMYYIVNDQDKWLNDPRGTVQYLLDNLCDSSNYFDIEVQGYIIHICLIEQ